LITRYHIVPANRPDCFSAGIRYTQPLAPPRSSRLLAESALLYAAAIWGSTFFVVKGVLAYIDPVVLVGYRFTAAALLIGLWLVWRRAKLWHGIKHGLFLGFILWILYVAQTIGLGITTASNSGFITGLFIVFVPLTNWLLYRQRARVRHLAAVGLSLIGLWLLTGGAGGINAGDLLTLAAAVTYAIHVIYAGRCLGERGERRIGEQVDPWVLNFQQMLTVGLLALLTALTQGVLSAGGRGLDLAASTGQQFAVTSAGAWWTLLFLMLLPTITAYVAQLYGQRIVSATRAALIFTMEPVFAALFAWTLGREPFLALSALGGALMVAAMLVSEIEWTRPRRSSDAVSSG